MEIVILRISHIAPKIVMIPNMALITAILVIGIPVFILVMLLPAILELKKLRDEDTDQKRDNISEVLIRIMRMTHIVNIESELRFDTGVTQPLAKIIAFLPNLEI